MKQTTLSICTRRQFLAALGAAAAVGSLSAANPAKVRLAVTTDEIDEDLATAIVMLEEFGLRCVEIRNLWGKYNTEQPLEKILEAKALLDRKNLRTCVLDTGFFKVPLPPQTPDGKAKLEDQWQLLDRAFERTAILGVDCLRIFAFMLDPARNRGTNAEFERIAELLGEASRRARAKQMRLAIENVSGSYVATGADAAQLLKLVKDTAVGLTWDPNNAGMSGEKAFPDGYQLLDPARILHVHLRNYRREANGKVEWCAVGQGDFDNLGQIRALSRDKYSGCFALETHYRSPQGKAHATRTSLTALLKIIEQV
ncbi:MAG: sugar phosphate isomerase/epimerase [Verrucomicrobiota bacterium]|nr:sugar phosphate isomerase/epimerase [Verrucomicrobiota bacterium]